MFAHWNLIFSIKKDYLKIELSSASARSELILKKD